MSASVHDCMIIVTAVDQVSSVWFRHSECVPISVEALVMLVSHELFVAVEHATVSIALQRCLLREGRVHKMPRQFVMSHFQVFIESDLHSSYFRRPCGAVRVLFQLHLQISEHCLLNSELLFRSIAIHREIITLSVYQFGCRIASCFIARQRR